MQRAENMASNVSSHQRIFLDLIFASGSWSISQGYSNSTITQNG